MRCWLYSLSIRPTAHLPLLIADLSQPTNYLHSLREGRYNLIDNIIVATKFVNKNIAQQICDECSRNFQMDLVVIPIIITYEILEEI